MRTWGKLLKRGLLGVVATAIAFSWTQTGNAQAPCIIERGQDPLDILNSGLRHNVWIVLDSSGSMDWAMDGNRNPANNNDRKMAIATKVLTRAIDEFVDSAGNPLVNWGFVKYASNSTQHNSSNSQYACNAMFSNRCVGLDWNTDVEVPGCADTPTDTAVKARLASMGPTSGTGSTPNGISLDQLSSQIVANNYVNNLLPNQKNFIILVTDGDDTCECRNSNENNGQLDGGVWTPTPSPPFVGGNVIQRRLRGYPRPSVPTDPWSSQLQFNAGTNQGHIQAINAGTKGRLAYERLNPTAADRATGAKGGVFVIGLGLTGQSEIRTNHIAWEASGAHYNSPDAIPALFANDEDALINALRDAFAKIGIPQSTVTLGSPTVGTVREVIPQHTNNAVTAADLFGEVGPANPDPDDVRKAREIRGNHQNNVLFDTTVTVPGFRGTLKAFNIYRVTDSDPAKARTARAADFTEIWDAGDLLSQRTPNSRNILFNRRGSTVLEQFDASNLSAADLGVSAGYLGSLSDNDARDMVIGVIRGYRLSRHPTTGTYYDTTGNINFDLNDINGNPQWKLLDAIASPTIVANPPRSPDFDPPQAHVTQYGVGGSQAGDGFYWDHFNRDTMVYLPTNGGMMHAFNAATGDEVFAYIPDDVISLAPGEVAGSRDTLAELVALLVEDENGRNSNGIVNHRYYLSRSATVEDAFLRQDRPGGDDMWHTLLTFGRGRGGRFVTALDITNPSLPLLQWNVGNREGINDGDLDGLGETWSVPVMGNVDTGGTGAAADQWLAFLGGGYGCDNNNDEGRYLFALRLEDGVVYHRAMITNDSSAPVDNNALVAMPTLYNPHIKDTSDKKDFVTRVYIPDVQGNIWKMVTLDQNPANWSFEKFASVGNDQPIAAAVNLLRDPNQDRIFVLAGTGADSRVDASNTTFKFLGFIDTDPEGGNTFQYPVGSEEWSQDLDPEYRVFVPPVTIGEVEDQSTVNTGESSAVVFFAASKLEFNTTICEGETFSQLWALGVTSGQPEVDLDGNSAPDDNVDLGQGKVTGLFARDGNLYVSESGGIGQSGSLSVYGDGDFSDEVQPGGAGVSIQVLVDGFRVSPF